MAPSSQDLEPPGIPPRFTALLTALIKSRGNEDWEPILESILNYNLANTDSSDMPLHFECVFLVSSFERLLDCGNGKEDQLANEFSQLLRPQENITLSSCKLFKDEEVAKRFGKAQFIREAWIRDFFRYRGEMAHGIVGLKYPGVWTIRDHLLLGSYVFPIVLKLRLEQLGNLSRSESDQSRIDGFELYASHRHFDHSSTDHKDFPWHKVREEISDREMRKSFASAMKMLPTDSDNPTSSNS
jgi:hypothetical protein